jgi:hypothetical protein
MKKKCIVITIVILACILLNACNNSEGTTPSPSTVSVVSLKENLGALEKEARAWQSDAYLAWVNLRIRLDYPENTPIVTAEFYSPSVEFESLGINLATDGSITSESVEYEVSIFHRDPITLNDWEVDSQEALDIMLDDEGLDFLRSTDTQCSILMLERRLDLPDQPVVWRLTLMDCLGPYVRHIMLDPISGEILEDSK